MVGDKLQISKNLNLRHCGHFENNPWKLLTKEIVQESKTIKFVLPLKEEVSTGVFDLKACLDYCEDLKVS